MRRINLELPRRRLELQFRFVKRRKPLVSEPLVPTPQLIRKKYRSGSFLGKIIRHISGHKNAKRVVVVNMAAFVVVGSYLPAAQAQSIQSISLRDQPDETVIQTQNTLTTQKSIQYPLDKTRINQGYSYFHPGIDLGADMGDSIKPIKSGDVIEAGFETDGYGNTVVVDHGQGLASRYAHLDKIEVKTGEEVTTQTEIGTVGVTGHSTGPHLHLEIYQKGSVINPLTVLSR